MSQSRIEWTELTWNPTTGCTKISAGCKYCYAEIMSKRLKAMGTEKYKDGFEVRCHPETLTLPYSWKTRKVVFVNSMSDLFHHEVPFEFIADVFRVMNENPQHVFQVLTKRAERLFQLHDKLHWTPNIWMGVSVESKRVLDRIEFLKKTDAKLKFLSIEPLLESLPALNLEGIDWVIVGGESGTNPRPMKKEWVIDIQKQCEAHHIAFFFKQWGGRNKKLSGRELDGKTYNGFPEVELRIVS